MVKTSRLVLVTSILLLIFALPAFASWEVFDLIKFQGSNNSIAYNAAENILYVGNWSDGTIYKIDAATGENVGSIPYPADMGWTWGMDFDGSKIKCRSWNLVYTIDAATGADEGSVDIGLEGNGLAFDGENYWYGDGTYVKKITPAGAVLDSIEIDAENWVSFLAILGDTMFVSVNANNLDRVDMIEISTKSLIDSYVDDARGITTDGTFAYTFGWNDESISQIYIGRGAVGDYPKVVSNLTVTADESAPTSVFLSWANPTESMNGNAETVVSANIYNAETGELVANAVGVESYEVTGLTAGVPYTFYVRAVDDEGNEGAFDGTTVNEIAGGVVPVGGLLEIVEVLSADKFPDWKWYGAVTCDGENVWIGSGDHGNILKVDLATGDTLKKIDFDFEGGYPLGACYANDFLYFLNFSIGRIYEIDPETGYTEFYFDTGIDPDADGDTEDARGLAWDGEYFWVANVSGDASLLWLYDEYGDFVKNVEVDTAIDWSRGLEWVIDEESGKRELWVLDSNDLKVYDYDGTSLTLKTQVDYWWQSWPIDLCLLGDGNMLAMDYYLHIGNDGYVLQTGGTESSVSDDYSNSGVAATYKLEQNYPNPFNPETQITYTIPNAGKVCIEVYNILGQKIAELVNTNQIAGTHTAKWSGMTNDNRPAGNGIYFYKMTAGDFINVKKMTLLK